MATLRINIRILWNHIMKNFQVKHGQCDSIAFPKTFSFENSKWLLDLCLDNSRILYFWQVLKSIHKFIIELNVVQYVFVMGSNNKQRKGRIISNFRKGETFFITYDNHVLLGDSSKCGASLLSPPKLGLSLLFSFAKKRIYLETQVKGGLTDLFWKLPWCSLFLLAE